MCFNQRGDISTLNACTLKLVDKFTYPGSCVSSTETDIKMRLAKAWTATYRQSDIWKLDLTDKIKRIFFQATVVSILLYGGTTWTITKRMVKKAWRLLQKNTASYIVQVMEAAPHKAVTVQPPTLNTKTIKLRRARTAGHCYRSRDELVSDVIQRTPSHRRAKAGWPAWTYIQQLCNPEDLPEAMDDWEE